MVDLPRQTRCLHWGQVSRDKKLGLTAYGLGFMHEGSKPCELEIVVNP